MHVVASFVGSFVACCVLLLTRCALVRCAVILALFGYVCMEMRDKDRRLLPIKELVAGRAHCGMLGCTSQSGFKQTEREFVPS